MPVHNLQLASKVELLASLLQHGWVPVSHIDNPHMRNMPLELVEGMLSKSRLYLACLVQACTLWDVGIPFVAPNMPDEYYQCCMELSGSNMTAICARPDWARLANAQWRRLRQGVWRLIQYIRAHHLT